MTTIAVKAIGSFFLLDEEGHLINPGSLEHLSPRWHSVLNEIKTIYQQKLGKDLHSIYLRGSLVRNTWQEGISDLDSFALVYQSGIHWAKADFQAIESQRLQAHYPFLGAIEFNLASYTEDFEWNNPKLAMVIKTQSLLLWGADITMNLPKYRIGAALKINIPWFQEDWSAYQLDSNPSPSANQALAKLFIRIGFELVLEREKAFTCDLYPAVNCFGHYYPAQAALMQQILFYYLNPTENTINFRNCLLQMGQWLQGELL